MSSARTVGYRPLPDLKKIRRELCLALRACGEKNISVRLMLWEGKTFVVTGAREIPEKLYKTGVVLQTAPFPRGKASSFPYQVKASAYQQAVLASAGSGQTKPFDWLFLDQGNYLTETRAGNFFIVKHLRTHPVCENGTPAHTGCVQTVEAELLTPPEHLILNGVTRGFVIKCAHELGLKVRETPLTRHDFFNADEAFLTNSSWEMVPVRELDGRAIGGNIPGPVTMKLHRLFKRRVRELCPNK